MRELVGKLPSLGPWPHAAGIDQGGAFRQVTGRSDRKTFFWRQHVTLIFPRVFEHAFLSLLCFLLFFRVERWSVQSSGETRCVVLTIVGFPIHSV